MSNLLIAIANLALSVALIRRMGLIGVALGTLIPLAAVSIFVLFPAACRRVELGLPEALKTAIFPALWPACYGSLSCDHSQRRHTNLAAIALQR